MKDVSIGSCVLAISMVACIGFLFCRADGTFEKWFFGVATVVAVVCVTILATSGVRAEVVEAELLQTAASVERQPPQRARPAVGSRTASVARIQMTLVPHEPAGMSERPAHALQGSPFAHVRALHSAYDTTR